MSAETTTGALLSAIAGGMRLIELGQPLFTGMPCSPNQPGFRMTLGYRHGDVVRTDGGSAANEVIVTGGHVGTHIDAFAHISHEGSLHGGIDAQQAQRGGQFSSHGVETIPPLCTRGILLDIAALHGTEVLDAGYGITADDLDQAGARAAARPGRGDVVVIRTGWARYFPEAQRYLGEETGVPGVTEDAARWLADHGVVATGADTTAYEQIPAGQGHRVLPVHRFLLVQAGVYIIEHLNLESAAEHGLTEFVFLAAPLRIVGGTGSPIRPVALIGA